MKITAADAYASDPQEAVRANEKTRNIDTRFPASWGSDTVFISSAALALAESQANRQPAAGREAGQLSIGGEVVDVKAMLKEMDKTDFGNFVKTLEKLRSGDPSQVLDALSDITGKPNEAIREAFQGMSARDVTDSVKNLAGSLSN